MTNNICHADAKWEFEFLGEEGGVLIFQRMEEHKTTVQKSQEDAWAWSAGGKRKPCGKLQREESQADRTCWVSSALLTLPCHAKKESTELESRANHHMLWLRDFARARAVFLFLFVTLGITEYIYSSFFVIL